MNFIKNINTFSLLVFFWLSATVINVNGAEWDKKVEFEPLYVEEIHPVKIDTMVMQPGLLPYYYLKFFERDLRRLPRTKASEYRSFQGDPILRLDHQFEKEKVFNSGTNSGVGIRMTGYIRFAEKGRYEMQALSNDGIILYIDKKVAISDPEQHSDRLSNIAVITIDEAGWFPAVLEYFQRKGTSALKLKWKMPKSDSFVAIPEAAYGHTP